MSRRSRRRRSAGNSGWIGKLALGLVVVGLVAAALFYAGIRRYLYSDAFRLMLSQQVSKATGVKGEFGPFRWDGLAVDTSGFDAKGAGDIREMQVKGLHTEVGLGGFRRGVWELNGIQVQRAEISLDARNVAGIPTAVPASQGASQRVRKSGWLPSEVAVQGLDVREIIVRAVLNQGPASITGMRLRMVPGGGKQSYQVELTDGAVVLPFDLIPTINLRSAHLRYQDGMVFLNDLKATAWKDGRLEATGELDSSRGQYTLQGNVSDVKCGDLLNETWAKRLTGDVETDFTIDNTGGVSKAGGHLVIRNGTLTALPVLDSLAAYADTRRFRVLTLSEAHTDWQWKGGDIVLSKLVLASEGLVRLEGGLSIRNGKLDGVFRLGLAPGTLARIPGAETDVFLPGENGLVWAPLRITGTLDDPKEDLTDRLVEAAGARMFDILPETGERVIKYSYSLLGEGSSKAIEKKVLDKGRKIIHEGSGILGGVGGVLEGILDSGKPEDPGGQPKEP